MQCARRDSGSIVLGWLTKLVVVLALLGVIAFDAISVGVAHLNGSDDANNAATAAATAWQQTHQVQAAYAAALATITNPAETLLERGFVVNQDGSVRLLIRRKASTMVVAHIGPLKKYADAVIEGDAPPYTP
jgi:hypothetical protein